MVGVRIHRRTRHRACGARGHRFPVPGGTSRSCRDVVAAASGEHDDGEEKHEQIGKFLHWAIKSMAKKSRPRATPKVRLSLRVEGGGLRARPHPEHMIEFGSRR